MKHKRLYFAIALFVVLSATCGSVFGQNIFDQIHDGLDKINKSLDNASQITEQSEKKEKKDSDSTKTAPTITTPHHHIEVKFLKCFTSGNDVLMEFLITNRGTDLANYRIKGGSSNAKAFDESGNQYWLSNRFGSSGDNNGREASNRLSKDISVKVVTRITNVASEATKFTEIRMRAYSYNSSYKTDGDIVFKNVTIKR